MKILVYNWMSKIAACRKLTQKYMYFDIFNTRDDDMEVLSCILPEDYMMIKRNKWKLIYRELGNVITTTKVSVYTMPKFEKGKTDPNWVGTLELDSNKFFLNPDFKDQKIINLVISKIRGE